MNDRFKFRVWDNKMQKFHIVFFMHGIVNDTLEGYAKDDNFVLEQCTGLKDKNGKLIYEGDIVKIIDKSSRKEPFVGVVEYTNTASFEANCNGFYMHLHNPKTPEIVSMIEKMFCSSLREIEVIGNIHDNTDLLGEKQWHI